MGAEGGLDVPLGIDDFPRHAAAKAGDPHLDTVEVSRGLELLAKPAEHLPAGIAHRHADDADAVVELVHQLLAVAVKVPGVLLADGDTLSDDALPGGARPAPGAAPAPTALVSLAEHERSYIQHVLKSTKNNKNLAAKILGVTRRSLYRKLDKHELKS